MDTQTVLKIIAMLDERIERFRPHSTKIGVTAVGALEDFRDYLQDCFEFQVNQVKK